MSQDQTENLSILLPSASIFVFSKDKETLAASSSLNEDWRFARVTVSCIEGDVNQAISIFETKESPDLIVIQTDTIDESFTDQLEALSAHCSENTAAIVIGPDNDVNLYRALIGMGVSDYLVRPVTTDILAEDIAKTLIDRLGVSDSRLLAFVGSKGGVGTSTLAYTMACGMATDLDQKTILMDAAGGWSYLSVAMGGEPTTTLFEAIRAAESEDQAALDRILLKSDTCDERLSYLATGAESMLEKSVRGEGFEVLLDRLMTLYPCVVVDLSQAPTYLMRRALARAHKTFLVSTSTLPSLRAARSLLQEIKDIRGGSAENVDFIINKAGVQAKHEVPASAIEESMDKKPAATITYQPEIFRRAEAQGQLPGQLKEAQKIVQQLLSLTHDVPASGGGEKAGSGLLGKLLSK